MLTPEQCSESVPNVKIGFFNMMPDAALTATERQFFRLLCSNDNINCYVYPFRCDELDRSEHAHAYLKQHYQSLENIQHAGLDALVVTGANITESKLAQESFWQPLKSLLLWSKSHLKSTLCSCLATHAAMQVYYDVQRRHMGDKCWGVFEHHVTTPDHELLTGVEKQLFMVHSRYNDVSADDFLTHNIKPLICSNQAGVQLAAEEDHSVVYFQGHPEYDDISLLKEYKREIIRFLNAERSDYPPLPANYFDQPAILVAQAFQAEVKAGVADIKMIEKFPESQLQAGIESHWQDSATLIFSNWLASLVDNSDRLSS